VTASVADVPPGIAVHGPSCAGDDCHLYVYAGWPVHVPGAAVSVLPASALPEIVGG
jgi:hypothetical protein